MFNGFWRYGEWLTYQRVINSSTLNLHMSLIALTLHLKDFFLQTHGCDLIDLPWSWVIWARLVLRNQSTLPPNTIGCFGSESLFPFFTARIFVNKYAEKSCCLPSFHSLRSLATKRINSPATIEPYQFWHKIICFMRDGATCYSFVGYKTCKICSCMKIDVCKQTAYTIRYCSIYPEALVWSSWRVV